MTRLFHLKYIINKEMGHVPVPPYVPVPPSTIEFAKIIKAKLERPKSA